MVAEIISKKEFDELMSVEGEGIGITLKAGAEFIKQEIGEEGVKKLEDTMERLGVPIRYKEMKSNQFYSLGLSNLSLVLTQRLFNFDDEKLKELGKFVARSPLFVRRQTAWNIFSLAIKGIFSPQKLAEETTKLWRRYFTVGDFEMAEFNNKEKYIIYRLRNFPLHPVYCKIFEGTLSAITQMVFKKRATCQETKSPHEGGEYHEFLVKWK